MNLKKRILFCFVFVGCLLAFINSRAATITYVWTGTSSTLWTDLGNWTANGGVASNYPGGGAATTDIVQIGVAAFTGNQPTLNIAPAKSIATLTIGNTTGTTLTLNAALTVTGSINITGGTLDVNAALAASTATFTATSSTLNIDAATVVSGTGSSTTLSGCVFTSNSSGTFSSTTMAVTGSTLTLGAQLSLTSTSATALTFTSGTTTINGTSSISDAGGLSITAGIVNLDVPTTVTKNYAQTGTLNLNAALSTAAMTISSGSAITTNSSGTIGATSMTITASTLTLGAAVNLSNAGTALTFSSGTTTINNTTAPINFTNAGNIIISAGTVNLGASITTTTGTYNQTGTLNLNATLSTGAMTINTGSAITSITGATITASSMNITDGTFSFGDLVTLSGNLTQSGTTSFSSTTSVSVSGNTTVSGTLGFNGNSTTTLALNSGTTKINQGGTFNISATAVTFTNTATITNLGTFAISGLSSVTNSGLLTITNGNNGGPISGTFTLDNSSITASGTLKFTNITGVVTMRNGSSITISAAATATSFIKNEDTFYAGVSGSPACSINLSSGFAELLNLSGGSFVLGPGSILNITVSGTTVSNAVGGTFTIASDVTGSGSIGPITGVSPFTGTFSVQRYLSGGSSSYRGYRSLSSPVYETSETTGGNNYNVYSINYIAATAPTTGSGGVAGGFTQAGNPTLYLYRDNIAPSNSSFTGGNFRGVANISTDPSYTIDIDGPGFNIPVGNGFLFFDRGNLTNLSTKFTPGTAAESITLTATGNMNTGPITVTPWFTPSLATLDYTSVSGNSGVLGFALVGNPYASSIDWNQYGSGITETNVGKTIYILDPLSLNYEVYNPTSPGGNVGTYSNNANIIASGQGFFVAALATGATLTFTEAAKTNTQVSSANSNLFLGAPPQAVVPQYFRLKLWQDTINTDAIIIGFRGNASQQFVKGEDAEHITGNGTVHLSSMSSDNIALSINMLPLPKVNPVAIPLKINVAADGLYQFTMPDIKSIPDLYDIWLMDAYKKDSLDIKHNPSYKFNVYTSDANSTGSARFSIVIRQNPALMVHLLNFTATKATDGAQVVWTTENEQNYTNFTVERSTDGGNTFDVLGGMASSALGTYGFLDSNPANNSANLYRLKIQDLNGTISYSSVVTLIYGNAKNVPVGISVYPNPSTDIINLAISNGVNNGSNLQVVNQVGVQSPSYGIKILSITGAVITSVTSQSASWQNNVSGLTPGTYIIQVTNKSNNTLVGVNTFVKL